MSSDPTTRALCTFLGIELEHTRRVVVILEPGKLPRVHITKQIRRRAGSETAALLSRTRTFDLVPTDETKRSFAEELKAISLDLGPRDDEIVTKDSDPEKFAAIRRALLADDEPGPIRYAPDVAIPREPT